MRKNWSSALTRRLVVSPFVVSAVIASAAGAVALGQTTRETAPRSTISVNIERINAERDAIRWNFQDALGSADKAIKASDFEDARRKLGLARFYQTQNPNIFAVAELQGMAKQTDELDLRIEVMQKLSSADRGRNATTQAIKDQQDREKRERLERQRHVASLIKEAQQLTHEGKFKSAMAVIDQILVLDPTNEYALGTRQMVEDNANIQEQRGYREEFDRQFVRQIVTAEEKRIPYEEIYRYPSNWPDISDMRDKLVAQERGSSTRTPAIDAMLKRRVPEVGFDKTPFKEALEQLRSITGANIWVNWTALQNAGITDPQNAPITVGLRNVSFEKLLRMVLAQAGTTEKPLAFKVDEDGIIEIDTAEGINKNVEFRVYDITDLLIPMEDFVPNVNFNINGNGGGGNNNNNNNNRNNNNRNNNNNNRIGGGGVGGAGGVGGVGGAGGAGGAAGGTGASREDLVGQITQVLKENVAPDTWREQGAPPEGAKVGSVRELAGQLIITQTPENHAKIIALFDRLREQRAIMITVETRFLTVSRNFLDDFGLDLDFIFNTSKSSFPNSKPGSDFSPIAVNQNSIGFTGKPTTVVPGSIASSSAFGDSMAISGSFLDTFQVNFLLRATQASQTTSTVNAPRLTLFNGQRSYIRFSTQQSYVSDLQATTGDNSAVFDPTVDTLESGIMLDVRAAVTADRKYVTMVLQPSVSTLIALDSFQVQGSTQSTTAPITGGTGGTGNGGTGTGGAGGQAGYIQQPRMQLTELRTIVTVPDRGTLLLGGQTIIGEIEREQGVPILSKIPFLKRLFTNRSMAKDEQVSLILVKPTIIIQREMENKQFPGLNSRGRD